MARFDHFLGHVFDNRYTVVSVIGEGESAVVFGVFDGETGETLALKMLRPDCDKNSEAAARFETEISLLSLFDHPNIVKLLDTSKGGEYRYFVMEYIEGITLKKHIISRGALETDEILFLSRQILSALEHVHSKGIIHSDIKPQNIVIVGSGNIKLMDFGIAKSLSNQKMEISEVAVGTVQYVSPEQAEGKPLDHLSDIYSFGVVLYEMATGILPFVDENANRIAAMHVSEIPLPPTLINENIPEALEKVILRTMEKLPLARYQSAKALLRALENANGGAKKKPFVFSLEALSPKNLSREVVTEKATSLWEKIKHFSWRDIDWKELFSRQNLPSCFAGVLAALLLSITVGLCSLSAQISEQKKQEHYAKIPSLVGVSYASIDELALDPDHYEIEVQFVKKNARAGLIVSQSRRSGSIFEIGDEPFVLHVKVAKLPLPAQVPSLASLDEEEALTALAAYNCKVKTRYLPHALIPEGHAVTALQTGKREVTLYISEGYREVSATVPSFVGLSREDAKKLALDEGFSCVVFSGDGMVDAQSIPAGTVVNAADTLLVLSTEK